MDHRTDCLMRNPAITQQIINLSLQSHTCYLNDVTEKPYVAQSSSGVKAPRQRNLCNGDI